MLLHVRFSISRAAILKTDVFNTLIGTKIRKATKQSKAQRLDLKKYVLIENVLNAL